MNLNTLIRYDFSARLSTHGLDGAGNDVFTYLKDVSFALRSNGTTTLRLLGSERFPYGSVLDSLTDAHGQRPFASEASSTGERWQVFHAEPIYDGFGSLAYWLMHVKRV